MDLNELRDGAYKIACENGFHDKEHNNGYYLMLVIGDLSEAVKAYEEKHHTPEHIVELLKPLQSVEYYLPVFNYYTEETVDEKLADVFIRLLDLAGLKGVDLESEYVFINDLGPDFISSIYNICKGLTYSAYSLSGRVRDAIESIMLLCRRMRIDLEWVVEEKMKYDR